MSGAATSGRVRFIVAPGLALCIVCMGIPPVLAHRSGGINDSASVTAGRALEALGRHALTGRQLEAATQSPAAQYSEHDLARLRVNLLQLREKAAEYARTKKPGMTGMKNQVPRIERALEFLAIAGARDGAERHRLIRQLPVQVVETAATVDGQPGTYKHFIAGGKTRLSIFTPHGSSPAPLVALAERAEQPATRGGPFVPELSPIEDCYYEGEWGPCATEQEIEDALILGASLEAEEAQVDAAYRQAEFEHQEYCRNYPWACSQDELPMASGPHCGTAVPNCVGEILTAASGLYTAIDRRLALVAATGPAVRITTAALGWKAFGAILGLAAAGFAVATAANCISYLFADEPEVALSSGAKSSSTVQTWLGARAAINRSFVLPDLD